MKISLVYGHSTLSPCPPTLIYLEQVSNAIMKVPYYITFALTLKLLIFSAVADKASTASFDSISNTSTATFPIRITQLTNTSVNHLTISSTGQCGGFYACFEIANPCCSQWGFCGSSSVYCGLGCQANFGICDNLIDTNTNTTLPVEMTTTICYIATFTLGRYHLSLDDASERSSATSSKTLDIEKSITYVVGTTAASHKPYSTIQPLYTNSKDAPSPRITDRPLIAASVQHTSGSTSSITWYNSKDSESPVIVFTAAPDSTKKVAVHNGFTHQYRMSKTTLSFSTAYGTAHVQEYTRP